MKYSRRVFKHFLECCITPKRLNHTILLHRAQVAGFQTLLTNLLHGSLLQDRIAYVDVRDKQFINSDSAAISGEIAGGATLPPPKSEIVEFGTVQAKTAEYSIFRGVINSAAGADLAN